MPYLFTCPHCQTKTQVEDRYSGQRGECVTCGGEIHIPAFAGDQSLVTPRRSTSSVARWVIAALVSLILIGCLILAVVRLGGSTLNRLSASRQRSSSIANLEKIASALNAYAADHGSYPPPVTRDAKGKKLHSWRVLILPYLDEDALYNRFDLNLSWDDPVNSTLASMEMPSVYRHPNASVSGRYTESSYYLVVGQGTLFPKSGPLAPDQVVDDPSQTLLVVEATPLIPSAMWTEPIDLEFGKMSGNIGINPGIEAGGLLDDGVAVVTVDGRGHFISDTMNPGMFRGLVTPRGGERMADDTLD